MENKEAAGLLSRLYSDALVVITSRDEYQSWEKLNGQVALTALPASIVPEYPRVLIEVWQNNLTHDLIKNSGVFAVHLLRPDQYETVKRFGFSSGRDHNKFVGLDYDLGETGCPLLSDCFGWLECRVYGSLDSDDMTVFLGEVVAAKKLQPEGDFMSWEKVKHNAPDGWLDEYKPHRERNEAWAKARLQQNSSR